eukprot:g4254.t1
MQPNAGFGHLDSLVDEIQKKQSDHVKLESQLRQQRLRAESEAAEVSRLKSELEASAIEKLSLQKRIGMLSRKNEDLAGENAKLLEEKCDFQRSMANNEAKLRENESDLRAARKNFVEKLDEANAAYSRNRAAMNTMLGRTGPGCAEIPSPEDLDALRAAAAKAQEADAISREANLMAAETEARMRAVVADSKALKGEAAENDQKLQSLRQEVAALKDALKSRGGRDSSRTSGAQAGGTTQQQETRRRMSELEREVAQLREINSGQESYMAEMEAWANTIEAANDDLRQQLAEHGTSRGNEHGEAGAASSSQQQDDMMEDDLDEGGVGQDQARAARKEGDAVDLMPAPAPCQGGRAQRQE